jgi:hypothetical protein
MRGRYPDGPELLDQLDGAEDDKRRVLAVWETVLGLARVQEVCDRLGIGETRFRQLRALTLRGAIDGVRCRPGGRPRHRALADAVRIRELEQELAEARLELQQALVRAEVALILPQRTEEKPTKKGQGSSVKLRKRKPR